MQIDYLDGRRLKQGIIAGARRVIQMQENLNRINVFPVADNDTGTNLALTLQSIAEGVISCRDQTLAGMSRCAAESALMGARGNSGAILAQFFQGLAESFNGKVRVTCQHFGEAVDRARESAYEAIANPQEGTILTVIHEWAETVKEYCHRTSDFRDLLKTSLTSARKSLKETPKKLKLLAQAGVVDAGAQGFVHLLEGILHFMESGTIERMVGIGGRTKVARAKVNHEPRKITYRFCTECLLKGSFIDRPALRAAVTSLGDSIIVAGSPEKVRIHIHTDHPDRVFEIAAQHGEVQQTKSEDMRAQHGEAYGDRKTPTLALVTDSACDLPSEFIIRHNLQMVPLQVAFGQENFIDKINITPREFYRMLEEAQEPPTTSQPTPGDFVNAYQELWGHYERAVSIHLSGALSGTLQAAQTAAKQVGNERVTVIDSRNVSVGLGLIVAEAAEAVESGAGLQEVAARVQWAIKNVRLFVTVATLEHLMRSGRVGRLKGFVARSMNLLPILAVDEAGKAEIVAKTFGGKAALKKVMELLKREAAGKRRLRFAVAHANAPDVGDWFAGQIRKQFEVRDVMVVDVSPALGAHAGPGAAGVAFLGA